MHGLIRMLVDLVYPVANADFSLTLMPWCSIIFWGLIFKILNCISDLTIID